MIIFSKIFMRRRERNIIVHVKIDWVFGVALGISFCLYWWSLGLSIEPLKYASSCVVGMYW